MPRFLNVVRSPLNFRGPIRRPYRLSLSKGITFRSPYRGLRKSGFSLQSPLRNPARKLWK